MGHSTFITIRQIQYNYLFQIDNIINLFIQNKYAHMQPTFKMRAPSGLRQYSVCSNSKIFLAAIYDTIKIYDIDFQTPIVAIKLDSTPRSSKLSQCGKYFYVHDSSDNIYLYDTKYGILIQKVIGVPISIKSIRFSKNSQKLIYAGTQMICLWNIPKCAIDVRTQHWRNMNCYDINADGTQFVIGTYNGVIYVLDFVQVGKCQQVSINRHKTCVAAICSHQNQIISASHDGYFLISTITKNSNKERSISYQQMKMKSIPRQIQSIGDNFYMFNNQGMTWFNKNSGFTLTGFTDRKNYKPFLNEQGKTMFVSLHAGEMEWWPSNVFKTKKEIEKQQMQRQKLQKQKQLQKDKAAGTYYRVQTGKQNNVYYRITYRG